MNCKIKYTKGFSKEFKALAKRYRSLGSDYARLLDEIEANPRLGTDLGDGLRKIRMAITSKGKGKSAGARVITYTVLTHVEDGVVVLVSIYDKSEHPSMLKRDILARLKSEGLL